MISLLITLVIASSLENPVIADFRPPYGTFETTLPKPDASRTAISSSVTTAAIVDRFTSIFLSTIKAKRPLEFVFDTSLPPSIYGQIIFYNAFVRGDQAGEDKFTNYAVAKSLHDAIKNTLGSLTPHKFGTVRGRSMAETLIERNFLNSSNVIDLATTYGNMMLKAFESPSATKVQTIGKALIEYLNLFEPYTGEYRNVTARNFINDLYAASEMKLN